MGAVLETALDKEAKGWGVLDAEDGGKILSHEGQQQQQGQGRRLAKLGLRARARSIKANVKLQTSKEVNRRPEHWCRA